MPVLTDWKIEISVDDVIRKQNAKPEILKQRSPYLYTIAEKALEKDTGARALRAIIEEFMLDIMYEIPKDDNIGRVVITKEYIEGNGGPVIDIRNNAVTLEERDNLNEIEVKA